VFDSNRESNSKNKKKPKNSQLIIRIHRDEREQFVNLCDALGTTAAKEIRRFIADFVERQSESLPDKAKEELEY